MRSDFSILKRKTNTGIRYYIRYAWNQDKGRYSKTLSTDFSTKKQAEKYAKVEVPKLLLHLSIKNEDNPKVSDFLKEAYTPGSLFLQNKINQGKPLEDEYLPEKTNIIKKYYQVRPWTVKRLSELKPVDIEKFRNQLLMRLQPGMINKIFYVLSVPLKYHCSIHNIPYQLLSVKKLSTAKQSKENARGALSLLEIQAILSLVPVEGDDKILVRMCKISLLTGVRISELRAIQAGDINRETGFLSIARQTKRHRDDTKGCKAGSSGRVPLFSPLTELLEEQVKHYGVELSGDDYLFIRWDGRKYKEDAIRSAFYRMLARIGIDEVKRHNRHLSFHSSRHSYVTMLQQAGFSMLQAMSAARHKKIEQTFVYSHPEALDFSKEKERLSGMLKRHNTVVS